MYEYTPEQLDYATMIMTLFVAIFVATVFVWGVCKPHWFKPVEFSDKFDLGYIEDRQQGVVLPMAELFEEVPTARQTRRQITPKPKPRRVATPKPKPRPKPQSVRKPQPKPQQKPQPKPQPKPKKPQVQKPAQSPEFIEDCIAALIALGEKKTVAKKQAITFLTNNPEVTDLDNFLTGIFTK